MNKGAKILLIYDDEHREVEVEGDLLPVLTAVGVLLNDMYTQISTANHGAGEMFKLGLIHSVGDPQSPVWKKYERHGDGTTIVIDYTRPNGGN